MPLKDANGKVVENPTSVPNDREFRNAWVADDEGVVEVDLAKAKVIAKERIESIKLQWARDLMAREYAGEDVSAEKAKLLAINTTAVDNAQSVEALKAAWPSDLDRET